MTRYKTFLSLVKSDAYRYGGVNTFWGRVLLFLRTPGYNYSVKMRLTKYCAENKLTKVFFPLVYLLYRHAMFKYGISIPYKTKIGYGFYIGHFGGIVINPNVVIGNNVNVSQGVTIGQGGANNQKSCPVIGNRVYIGPKATIVGGIHIGNDAAIGANAFLNKDVEEKVSFGGVPAHKISEKGSVDYIHYKWKEE